MTAWRRVGYRGLGIQLDLLLDNAWAAGYIRVLKVWSAMGVQVENYGLTSGHDDSPLRRAPE